MIFLALLGAATCWSAGRAVFVWVNWHQFSGQTVPTSLSWSMVADGRGRNYWQAEYTYLVAGKEYTQAERLSCDRLAAYPKSWTVWYHPFYPERASLEHFHPLKWIFYALVQLTVLVYFIELRRKHGIDCLD